MAKKITESQLRSAVKSLRQYLGEAPGDSMPPDGSKFQFDWTDLNTLTDPPEDFSDFVTDGAVLTVLDGQWLVELPNGEKQTLSNPAYKNLFDEMHANQALQPLEEPVTPDPAQTPATSANDGDEGEAEARANQAGITPPSAALGGRSFADASRDSNAASNALGGRSFADASREANAARDAQAIKDLGAPKPTGFMTGAKPGQPPAPSSTAQRPPASQGSAQWGPGVLGLGSRGPEVSALQQKLNITDTGTYDQATKQAVMALQKKLNVTVDGAYGPETKGAEGKAAPATAAPAAAKPTAAPATDFKGAAGELSSEPLNKERAAGWQETPESYTSYREDATLARIVHLAGR